MSAEWWLAEDNRLDDYAHATSQLERYLLARKAACALDEIAMHLRILARQLSDPVLADLAVNVDLRATLLKEETDAH